MKRCDIDSLKRVAAIIGPLSAAGRAIAEYERRTALGQHVAIFEGRDSLVVGPDPVAIVASLEADSRKP